jgi:hypothetical protein
MCKYYLKKSIRFNGFINRLNKKTGYIRFLTLRKIIDPFRGPLQVPL